MPILTMKDMWYWSIVEIPLKVYGQPAVIHELESSLTMVIRLAQGPLLLEDDNRRLRLLTTREDIVLNPWIHIPFCVIVLLSCFHFAFTLLCSLRKLFLLSGQDENYLLGYKGITDIRKILIWRKVLRSRVCHGLTNFSLYRLTLFILCLLLLCWKNVGGIII